MLPAMLHWASDRWRFRYAVGLAARSALGAHGGSGAQLDARKRRDIVLVPCWRRPEMLWHCLENLCNADGIEAKHVVIGPDSGCAPDILSVIRSFGARLPSHEIQPTPRCP